MNHHGTVDGRLLLLFFRGHLSDTRIEKGSAQASIIMAGDMDMYRWQHREGTG